MDTTVPFSLTPKVSATGSLVSDETVVYLTYVFFYFCGPIIILFGLISNIFNINVFTKMGLKDSVTVSLFSLAISDFSYLLISAMRRSASIVTSFPEVAPQTISLSDVVYASFWYSMIFYDISMLIRVYTAVARACCVAIPLTFKNIFTRNVTIYVVCAVISASVAIRIPMLACQGFHSVFDSKTNITKLVFYFNSLRPAALAVTDIVNRNIIAWGGIIIVLISLFVLKYNLVSSAKFRHGRKSGFMTSSNENPNKFLVGKDLQVVRVVILVSIIFIVCNLPPAIPGVVRRVMPEYTSDVRVAKVLEVITLVLDVVSYINSSLNVLVYYFFNSKFRQIAHRILNLSKTSKI